MLVVQRWQRPTENNDILVLFQRVCVTLDEARVSVVVKSIKVSRSGVSGISLLALRLTIYSLYGEIQCALSRTVSVSEHKFNLLRM